jgi:hypothetical protein
LWYTCETANVILSKKFSPVRSDFVNALVSSELMTKTVAYEVFDLDTQQNRFIFPTDEVSDKFEYKFAAKQFEDFLASSNEVFIFQDPVYLKKGRNVIGYANDRQKAETRKQLRTTKASAA